LDTQYNKLGVKLVSLPIGPNGGYQFVLRQTILMNLAAWDRLTVAERKILTDEGHKAEDMWLKEAGRLAAEEEQSLVAKGMQITMMGEAPRAKLQRAFSDGILDLAAQKHPKEVEGLRAFAKSKALEITFTDPLNGYLEWRNSESQLIAVLDRKCYRPFSCVGLYVPNHRRSIDRVGANAIGAEIIVRR
jgi:hypothetical protein